MTTLRMNKRTKARAGEEKNAFLVTHRAQTPHSCKVVWSLRSLLVGISAQVFISLPDDGRTRRFLIDGCTRVGPKRCTSEKNLIQLRSEKVCGLHTAANRFLLSTPCPL